MAKSFEEFLQDYQKQKYSGGTYDQNLPMSESEPNILIPDEVVPIPQAQPSPSTNPFSDLLSGKGWERAVPKETISQEQLKNYLAKYAPMSTPDDASQMPGQINPPQAKGPFSLLQNKGVGSPIDQQEPQREVAGEEKAPVQSKAKSSVAKEQKPLMPSPEALQQAPQQPKEDYLAQLHSAQEEAKNMRLLSGIHRASQQFSAASAGVKPDFSSVDAFEKNASQPIEALQQKIQTTGIQNKLNDEQEMGDPNSPTSSMLRGIAAKYGMKLPDTTSGKHIAQVLPMIVQAAIHEEDRKARLEERRLNREAAGEKTKKTSEEKTTHETTKRMDNLNNKLSSSVSNIRMPLGKAAMNLQVIENAEALLNGTADLNNLDNRQVYESARILDRVLSGGTGGQVSSQHLTPESMASYSQGIMEKLSNKRRGANLGSFMATMKDTFAREKAQAQKQLKDAQIELIGSSKDLMEKDKDTWDTMMIHHKLPTDPFIKSNAGNLKKPNQIEQADWDKATDDEKQRAVKHFGG